MRVPSQRVTEALKGPLSLVGNQVSSASAQGGLLVREEPDCFMVIAADPGAHFPNGANQQVLRVSSSR